MLVGPEPGEIYASQQMELKFNSDYYKILTSAEVEADEDLAEEEESKDLDGEGFTLPSQECLKTITRKKSSTTS